MIEKDTIKLLRECDAGIKMGVDSINDVLPRVESKTLEEILKKSRTHHEELGTDIEKFLTEYHDDGKDPSLMAEAMSHMKTGMKMFADNSDATIADLMTDGCNMGIKSLCKYLNKYEAADERSKNITKKIVNIEEDLVRDLRLFL